MNVEIRRSPDAIQAAEDCGRAILIRLEDAMAAGAPATIAISGGSSPHPMFTYFARQEVAWDRVHVFWVDERAVAPTHEQSNYKWANELWLAPAGVPVKNIHRIQAELPPEEAARRYIAELREFFRLGPTEMPRFEVVHLGMGPDAHTASLFPGSPWIEDRTHIAAAAWVHAKKEWRITLLPAALAAARHTAFLAVGADKALALTSVLQGPYNPVTYPAQLASNAVWFLDAPAAQNL